MKFDRWQYLWFALATSAFGLAAVGYAVAGISVTALFPFVVGSGLLVVAVRPTAFGDVMLRIGVLSLLIAGLLTLGEASPLVVGVLALVGIGGVIVGRRSQRRSAARQ